MSNLIQERVPVSVTCSWPPPPWKTSKCEYCKHKPTDRNMLAVRISGLLADILSPILILTHMHRQVCPKKGKDKTDRLAKGYLWTFQSDGLFCFYHLRCLDSIPGQFTVTFQKSRTENIFSMVFNRQDWCYQRLASWLLCSYLSIFKSLVDTS